MAYKPAPKQITSWSYSRYRDWKRCPLFAKLKHLDKLPEPTNPAMDRGTFIGKLAEDYVKGSIPARVPNELKLFEKQFKAARAAYAASVKMPDTFVEEMWCFDKDWNPVAWNDWDNVWLRVKMDLCNLHQSVLFPIDHKTGKYREYDIGSYLEQLEIYALGGMLQFPTAVGVSPRLWFLDEGLEYPQDIKEEIYYQRSELEGLKRKWLNNVKPMLRDTSFRPTPNNKCQWCTYSGSKGGPCKY